MLNSGCTIYDIVAYEFALALGAITAETNTGLISGASSSAE